MPFQQGINLPPGTWDDWRTGTSLGSNLLRLVSGGLSDIGGVVRKDRYHADEIRLKEADDARAASQFAQTLEQRKAEHRDMVTRWDLDRAAKDSEDNALYELDPSTGRWLPKVDSTPLTFPTKPGQTVPQAMKETGSGMAPIQPYDYRGMRDAGMTTLAPTKGVDDRPIPATPQLIPVTPTPPARPFLRRKDAAVANAELDRAAAAEATKAFRTQTDKEQADAAAERKRVADAKMALVAGNRKLFSAMHPELTPEETDALAGADPVVADRFLGSLERQRTAKAKMEAAAQAEEATFKSAVGQIHDVYTRAQQAGINMKVPDIVSEGPGRTPAKEVVRLATAMEKNYDDAFHAKQAELSRSILDKKTSFEVRARSAQHQVDAFDRQLAAQKKVLDDIQKRISMQESFEPGSSAPLRDAEAKALDAFNRTVKARNSAYSIIGTVVGFENVVDPETGMPMATAADRPEAPSFGKPPGSPTAPAAPPEADVAIPDSFASKAEAKAWLDAHSAGLSPEDKAILEDEIAGRVKKGR